MEIRRALVLLLAFAAFATVVAGCGGSDEEGSGTESAMCDQAALTSEPKLPADFPKPGEVTYRAESEAGPSQIVEGTFDAGLDEAYDEYERAVEDAGYKVLFKEKEDHDAEISYEGGGTTGQIALRDECGGDKVLVHITNRPGA
jgi:hypothetical protein